MTKQIEWKIPSEELPLDKSCVLGAFRGQWQDGEEYKVVLPMFFLSTFTDTSTGSEHRDCFVDADNVVRIGGKDIGFGEVEFWCDLPDYPSN